MKKCFWETAKPQFESYILHDNCGSGTVKSVAWIVRRMGRDFMEFVLRWGKYVVVFGRGISLNVKDSEKIRIYNSNWPRHVTKIEQL
jgi:hypothetical protein